MAFRILVWAAAKFNWKGCVIDVQTAFLNATMEQDPDEDVLPSLHFSGQVLPGEGQCICHSRPCMALEDPQGCGGTTEMER